MTDPAILLLTEAGEGIGFGHLTRMMAVGDALRASGVETSMLVQWEGPPVASLLEGRSWVRDGEWRRDPVRACGPATRCVLIDSYRLPLAGYAGIAGAGVKLAVVDDFYRLPFPADLVVNPNVYGQATSYQSHAREAVAGVDWVILRPPFVRAAGFFKVRDRLERVLLTLGGSDREGLGRRLAGALTSCGEVVWIAPDAAGKSLSDPRVTVLGARTAEGMVECIGRCDLVVCGGGQTLHELACLGAPCVALEVGEDQRLNLDFYEAAGLLGARISSRDEGVEERVVQRVTALAAQRRRGELSALARTLIDGAGAARVAAKLTTLLN